LAAFFDVLHLGDEIFFTAEGAEGAEEEREEKRR
jgi:hypothetical protein